MRRVPPPAPVEPAAGRSCDAGQCDGSATGWRWFTDLEMWLPCCLPCLGAEGVPPEFRVYDDPVTVEQAVEEITAVLRRHQRRRSGALRQVLLCGDELWAAFEQAAQPVPVVGMSLGWLDGIDVVIDDTKSGGEYELLDVRSYAARLRAAGRADIPSTES